MPSPGYALFDPLYLFDDLWFNGVFIPNIGLSMEDAPGVIPLRTAGGTVILQRPFRGSLKPKNYDSKTFSFTVRATDEDAWYTLKEARATGGVFYFGSGVRQVDIFAATSGTTYRLSRPLASGIVTGITSVTHPTVVKLNGSVSPSSATVTGQNVLANATGTIAIIYTPVHPVCFSRSSEVINAFNAADAQIQLEECLEA